MFEINSFLFGLILGGIIVGWYSVLRERIKLKRLTLKMGVKIDGRLFLKVVSWIMAVGCGTVLGIWFIVSFASWDWQIRLPIYVVGAVLRLWLIAATIAGLVLSVEKQDDKN